MEDKKFITYIEVYRDNERYPIAVIEPYHDEQGKHPERKFCYTFDSHGIGTYSHYSETAETIDDMLREYIETEIDWAYCGKHNITFKFVPHYVEADN